MKRFVPLFVVFAFVASGVVVGTARAGGLSGDRGDGMHDRYPREWWRVQARVRAADGHGFGVVAIFFRVRGDARAGTSISAVFAVTDLVSGKRIEIERAGRETLGTARAGAAHLDTSVGAWSLRALPETSLRHKLFHLRTGAGSVAASLDFSAPPHPAVSDVRGYFVAGDAAESHFSAYTRATVSGTLTMGATTVRVAGTGWIDHVYGDASLSRHPAWSLYETQLDSGREVIDYVDRDPDGKQVSKTIVVDERGNAHVEPAETTTWLHGAGPYFWRSERTHVVYPDLYHLTGGFGIDVLLSPAVAAQEIVPHGDVPYWDGAMDVADFASTRKETGIGFAQLTGY